MNLLAGLQQAAEGRVEAGAPLAGRISTRVGGAAEFLVAPPSVASLARVLELCAGEDVAFRVLGGGANSIVSDAGVRGVVLKLPQELFAEEQGEDAQGPWVRLGAGLPIAKIVSHARGRALTGMEFLAGIPGTIGGAVSMNAGTKNGSTSELVEEIGVCDSRGLRTVSREEAGFAYRRNALAEGSVVVWAKFRLRRGDVQQSKAAMEADLAYRRRSQPLSLPNSGSVFRNPEGGFAAQLVESCGLKGSHEGGAQISEVHANFIVNRGGARAADVVALMKRMQSEVRARHGVALVPEVKLLGEFDPDTVPDGLSH